MKNHENSIIFGNFNATLTELEALKVEVAKKKYAKKHMEHRRRRGSGVALLVWGSITNLPNMAV